MKRRIFILPLAVAACTFASCRPTEDNPAGTSGPAVSRVKVATVHHGEFADRVEALGTVRAKESIDLSTNVTETVTGLHFEDGDRVTAGQLLVNLNDAEEKAMLESAKAQLVEQKREADRLRGLVKGGAVSEVRLQGYETQMEIAQRKIEEVEAQVADRTILAPYDGVLGFRRISVGALVSPGDVITTLDVMDPVKFDFNVPEIFLSDLKAGLEVAALSEAWPGEDFRGRVTQIDTRVNPVTRSVTVRAEIPNPDLKLRPGMLMTTTVSSNPRQSLFVPERALLSVQNDHFVFVVVETSQPAVAKRTPVKLGRRKPGVVEIIDGLEKGEKVITDGLIGLHDGAPVEIIGEFEGPSAPYHPSEES